MSAWPSWLSIAAEQSASARLDCMPFKSGYTEVLGSLDTRFMLTRHGHLAVNTHKVGKHSLSISDRCMPCVVHVEIARACSAKLGQ